MTNNVDIGMLQHINCLHLSCWELGCESPRAASLQMGRPVRLLRRHVCAVTEVSVRSDQGQACEARSSPHPSALHRPCLRPSERPAPPLEAGLTGRNGPGRARAVANRTGSALTGAVRTGRYAARQRGHLIQQVALAVQ